jgi:ketosteroid isomerase-like protein
MIGALTAKRKAAAALDALNRRDLESYMKGLADNATFVYPGDIPGISGVHAGKPAVRAVFERLFAQFPTIHFALRHVAVSNLWDIFGNNVVALRWDVTTVNRDGREGGTAGVTIATLRRGKVARIEDFIFDTGDKFRAAWGQRAVAVTTRP